MDEKDITKKEYSSILEDFLQALAKQRGTEFIFLFASGKDAEGNEQDIAFRFLDGDRMAGFWKMKNQIEFELIEGIYNELRAEEEEEA